MGYYKTKGSLLIHLENLLIHLEIKVLLSYADLSAPTHLCPWGDVITSHEKACHHEPSLTILSAFSI